MEKDKKTIALVNVTMNAVNPMTQYLAVNAPDIAGKNIANPTSLLLSGAMMLRYMGLQKWGDLVEESVRTVLTEGTCITRDVGGTASTDEFTDAVIAKLLEKKKEI